MDHNSLAQAANVGRGRPAARIITNVIATFYWKFDRFDVNVHLTRIARPRFKLQVGGMVENVMEIANGCKKQLLFLFSYSIFNQE